MPEGQSWSRGRVLDASEGERVTLKDGSVALVRAITPEDKQLLADAFASLSEESRYARFLAPKRELSPTELEFLTAVDHVDHEAIGAVDVATGAGLGVARYVRSRDRPEVAEAAVVVVDAWQGRGLGSELLKRLSQRAAENGIHRFSAVVLTSNRRMLHLFDEIGETHVRRDDGAVLEIEVELPVDRHEVLAEALREGAAVVVAAWLDLGAATVIPPGLARRRRGHDDAPRE